MKQRYTFPLVQATTIVSTNEITHRAVIGDVHINPILILILIFKKMPSSYSCSDIKKQYIQPSTPLLKFFRILPNLPKKQHNRTSNSTKYFSNLELQYSITISNVSNRCISNRRTSVTDAGCRETCSDCQPFKLRSRGDSKMSDLLLKTVYEALE
jgi:hypothetical protein